MKDLKHLIYFENLLQDAQNELVTKAVEDGQIALGYNCYYIPEVLLNLEGCFSSRLRAPNCTSSDIANYYMTNRTCPYARSILERALEGGYNYLSCLFGAESCATMERMEEHFFLINPVKHDGFFVTQIDPPMKGDQTNLDYYKAQLKLKVVDEMKNRLGVDVSDEAMRKAIEQHNELSRIITEIGNFRKLDNPPITGYEYAVLVLVSYTCPKRLILPYGVEKCVVALKRALQKRTGELAAVVGHVIGCKLHGIGVRCTKPDGEAIAQVHEHLRRVKAGVTERQVPLRLCLADKLVVRVLQQALKVNQMLQFFHCGSSPCVIFIFTRLCHQN